jgi:hypothetical protein
MVAKATVSTDVIRYSLTHTYTHQTTRRHIPGDSNLDENIRISIYIVLRLLGTVSKLREGRFRSKTNKAGSVQYRTTPNSHRRTNDHSYSIIQPSLRTKCKSPLQ